MEYKVDTLQFCIQFLIQLVKNWYLKVVKTWLWVLPFCAEQPAGVMRKTRLACGAKASNTILTNPFLLFSGKCEPTWLHPRDAQIILYLHSYCHNNQMKQADENISLFSMLSGQCASVVWFPFNNKMTIPYFWSAADQQSPSLFFATAFGSWPLQTALSLQRDIEKNIDTLYIPHDTW